MIPFFLGFLGYFTIFVVSVRFKRDFMLITDGNVTYAACFEGCQVEYKKKFEYTFNQSLEDFYDFPFHPIVLEENSFELYCTLAAQKTKCFAEKCDDYTAENSFSPSNFICSFKRQLFEKALKCLAKTEPITFLKCDQECHDQVVANQTTTTQKSQVFVSSEIANYEKELDKLCNFQGCYMKCMRPVIKEMCTEEETKSAIEIVNLYIEWHADDISDWHAITGNESTLPESCSQLVKNHGNDADDPILQIIGV